MGVDAIRSLQEGKIKKKKNIHFSDYNETETNIRTL